MNNRSVGLFLIGISILVAVISYGFDQLSNAIKQSASFIKTGGGIGWNSNPSVPEFSKLMIGIVVIIGIYLVIIKDKK